MLPAAAPARRMTTVAESHKRFRRIPTLIPVADGSVCCSMAKPAGRVEGPFNTSAGARNRYPRRGSVSIKLGASAESPSASRTLLIAAFRPFSKSTNVSAPQSLPRSSSRVTISPECSNSITSTRKGWSGTRIRTPFLRTSPERRLTSKGPNRYPRTDGSDIDDTLLVSLMLTERLALNKQRHPIP